MLQVKTDPEVARVFRNYPDPVKLKLRHLRDIILEAAGETGEITELVETLKWGEPSYLAKHGSTVRIDWKEKTPGQYAAYFKCTSRLVPTFRSVFGDTFSYEGDRAIVFGLDDEVPREALKKCMMAALNYHKVKQLPELGL